MTRVVALLAAFVALVLCAPVAAIATPVTEGTELGSARGRGSREGCGPVKALLHPGSAHVVSEHGPRHESGHHGLLKSLM